MAMRDGSTMLWKPGLGAQIDRSHPASRGLQSCWLFNESGGNTCYDVVGSAHFSLTGGVSRLAGPYGTAVKFDGSTGQGVAPSHPLASATAFTVILQLRQKDGLANPYGPYLGSDQTYNTGVYIGQNSPSVIQFYIFASLLNVPVVANDMWAHYAFSWTSPTGLRTAYANGVQTEQGTIFVGATIPAYAQAYIGKSSSAGGGYTTDSWVGTMKAYNRVLSAAEVAADYESPYAMFTPPNARRFFSMPVQSGSGSALPGGLSIGAGRLSIGV